MIKFRHIIDDLSVARQIATMLNQYNMLKTFHTEYSILDNKTEYIINISSTQNGFVLTGCIGVEFLNSEKSLIKHLCVNEAFRRQKIAENLLKKALTCIKTKCIIMNIRHTNIASLSLASKFGFVVDSYHNRDNYFILTVKKETCINDSQTN